MNKLKNIFIIFSFLLISTVLFAVTEIKSEYEFNELLQSGELIVVDFFATWCPPCKILSPRIEELANDFKGKVTFIKVDVDKFQSLAKKYGISSIPDVRIYKDKKEVKRLVGLKEKREYSRILKGLL